MYIKHLELFDTIPAVANYSVDIHISCMILLIGLKESTRNGTSVPISWLGRNLAWCQIAIWTYANKFHVWCYRNCVMGWHMCCICFLAVHHECMPRICEIIYDLAYQVCRPTHVPILQHSWQLPQPYKLPIMLSNISKWTLKQSLFVTLWNVLV